jgi:hypothetical protein
MIESKDFDTVYVANSNTEFVVVARGMNGFVPVIVSKNCGLDLMGFVASKGYVPEEVRDMERLDAHTIRSDIEEYHEAEVDIDEGADSSVYFYWKGAMPHDREEFLHACKTSLHQLFQERYEWKKSQQAFFSWHLGPIVFLIERENGYQALKKRRFQQNRKRSEALLTTFGAFGAIVIALFAVGISSDVWDALRSLFFSQP